MSWQTDECALFVRNIPRALLEADKIELFQLFKPSATEFIGKDSAKLSFPDPVTARMCLQQLHEVNIMGQRLNVKFARRTKTTVETNEERSGNEPEHIMLKFLKQANFNHIPSPYLRYKYPKATRRTVANIGVELLQNPAFYTQVIHLMNRLNLTPPFNTQTPSVYVPGEMIETSDTASQTDGLLYKPRHVDLCTDESELSEDQENMDKEKWIKRKIPSTQRQEDQKRFKTYLAMEKEARLKKEKVVIDPIATPKIAEKMKVQLLIPNDLPPDREKLKLSTIESTALPLPTKEEIATNRIPIEQLEKDNLVFKNYDPGAPSNVLYIKNLAKTVSTTDLELIYRRYAADPSTVHVDLKTTGRLRGQAFVRFTEANQEFVDEARFDTNGYLLKGRPIYVCYSKSCK